MKRCSQAHITQREKEAQELQQAILCLTVSAKTTLMGRGVILQRTRSLHLTSILVALQRSARSVVEESDALFTQLIRWIELKRFEVRELIKVQEKTSIGQAELLLEKIQKEIAELKMNEDELDKLSLIEDHISFLQVTPPVSFICPCTCRNALCTPRPVTPPWFCRRRAASLSRFRLSCQLCPPSLLTPASPSAPC